MCAMCSMPVLKLWRGVLQVAEQLMTIAYESGVNLFDTAEVYAAGEWVRPKPKLRRTRNPPSESGPIMAVQSPWQTLYSSYNVRQSSHTMLFKRVSIQGTVCEKIHIHSHSVSSTDALGIYLMIKWWLNVSMLCFLISLPDKGANLFSS